MKVTFEFLSQKRIKQVILEHYRILEALRALDQARLKQAMLKHLQAPTEDILQYSNLKHSHTV
jgi:DNA-binding GntR family transcriptional regulator